jgi:hypothetical protein
MGSKSAICNETVRRRTARLVLSSCTYTSNLPLYLLHGTEQDCKHDAELPDVTHKQRSGEKKAVILCSPDHIQQSLDKTTFSLVVLPLTADCVRQLSAWYRTRR